MQYSIKKELLESRYMAGYGWLQRCSMISVFDKEKTIGKFFHSYGVSYFAYGEEDVRINHFQHFLRPNRYPITDQKTNQIIGHYKGIDSFWAPYGKLILGEQVYMADKIISGISLFSKKTRVFTMKVGNDTAWVNYTVHIRGPNHWFHSVSYGSEPFEGEIELVGHDNLQLLFTGIFLLQHALDYEDRD